MRKMRSAAIFALVFALTTIGGVGTAAAAAPSNDTYAGRTVIGAVPFRDNIDTTEATTDADDAELTARCPAQAADASVWYEVTAPLDAGLQIRTFFSGYPATAIVATGGPGNWTVVACDDGTSVTNFPAAAGTTYTILVVDQQLDDGGNGGGLAFTLSIVDITVNRIATFNGRTGSATVTGTLLCTQEWAGFNSVQTTLTQRAGRFTVRGFANIEGVCDDTRHSWSVEILPDRGRFAGGKAAVTAFAYICEEFGCGSDTQQATLVLRPGR